MTIFIFLRLHELAIGFMGILLQAMFHAYYHLVIPPNNIYLAKRAYNYCPCKVINFHFTMVLRTLIIDLKGLRLTL